MKIKLKMNTLCAHDVHEVARYRTLSLTIKPELKAETVLKVTDFEENDYGMFYVCNTKEGYYYIPLFKAERIFEENIKSSVNYE